MAPEYFQGSLTSKADVYSFGVILLEIVSWRENVIKSNHGTEVLVDTVSKLDRVVLSFVCVIKFIQIDICI